MHAHTYGAVDTQKTASLACIEVTAGKHYPYVESEAIVLYSSFFRHCCCHVPVIALGVRPTPTSYLQAFHHKQWITLPDHVADK